MMSLLKFLPVVSFIACAYALGGAMQGMEDAMEIQREQLERLQTFLGPDATSKLRARQDTPTITFANPAAEAFFVDGTTIPEGSFSDSPPLLSLEPSSSQLRCRSFLGGTNADFWRPRRDTEIVFLVYYRLPLHYRPILEMSTGSGRPQTLQRSKTYSFGRMVDQSFAK